MRSSKQNLEHSGAEPIPAAGSHNTQPTLGRTVVISRALGQATQQIPGIGRQDPRRLRFGRTKQSTEVWITTIGRRRC
jgi:hypothetical protein